MWDDAKNAIAEAPRGRSLRENLEFRLSNAKKLVIELEHALKLLDENPQFEAVQNAIQNVGF